MKKAYCLAMILLFLSVMIIPFVADSDTYVLYEGNVDIEKFIGNLDTVIPSQHDAATLDDTPVFNFTSETMLSHPSRKVFNVRYIGQEPKYPCGCEGISAVMLLDHHGIKIDVDDFFVNALDIFPFTYNQRTNTYYGEDMDRYFVGDPTSPLGKGCFAPVIKNAIEKIVPSQYIAVVEQGGTVAELTDKYLKELDMPILIWATSGMRDSSKGTTWQIKRNWESVTFPTYMHCMVLVGYDDDRHLYYFNDPWKNSGLVSYDKDLVEEKFKELGSQALALLPRDEYHAKETAIEQGKTYAIRNAATGKYITILEEKHENGTNIIQNTYNKSPYQLFTVKQNSDGSVTFINKATGKAIDIADFNGSITNGCNVHLYTYNGLASQSFFITPGDNGFSTLTSAKNPSIALAAYGNHNGDQGKTSSSIGNIYMNDISEDVDFYQLWEFIEVG